MTIAATPLSTLKRVGAELGIDLRVKRDDLYPSVGGGTKARKVRRIFADCELEGVNAVVTTGGTQSNLARAVSLACAARAWPCTLVLHGSPREIDAPVGNLLVDLLTGASVRIVHPEEIASRIEHAVTELRQRGYEPAVVPGGGHCLSGTLALVEAVKELVGQCAADNWKPDWVVLASGTGTTQAGVACGFELAGLRPTVVGISVARRNPRGSSLVVEAYEEVRRHLCLTGNPVPIAFRDDWIGDGYACASPPVYQAIAKAARMEGLVLDPTYTGKAFLGLLDMVRDNQITAGSRVLFWHTGGLLNLMAEPTGTLMGGVLRERSADLRRETELPSQVF